MLSELAHDTDCSCNTLLVYTRYVCDNMQYHHQETGWIRIGCTISAKVGVKVAVHIYPEWSKSWSLRNALIECYCCILTVFIDGTLYIYLHQLMGRDTTINGCQQLRYVRTLNWSP